MKKTISLQAYLLILVPLLLFSSATWAADFPEISTSDLKNKLDAKESFFLLNSESDISFYAEHIPGAVNIPLGKIQATDKLPQDKNTLIVVYWAGKAGAIRAAGQVAKLGYKNVQIYSEGIKGWVKAGFPLDKDIPRTEIPPLTPSQLQKKLKDAYLLDVRPEKSYEQGHIKGSRNIPSDLI